MPAMENRTAQALIRFGLGRRGQEALPGDPQAWLAAQLEGPDPALRLPGASTADGLAAIRERRANPNGVGEKGAIRRLFQAEQARYVGYLLRTETPFRERLVTFWANHFTVSLRRGECAAVIHAYVREAIRPHVTGRFGDMLQAVMTHPAMLIYLDNVGSVGPDSRAGMRQKRGLNENLARECLELHTVTPASGYTQADVTEFARLLTGWSVELRQEPLGFMFRPFAHEPGERVVMGQRFGEGEQGGVAALAWLARHPATYHNLATQMVRQFVADVPPSGAVARIEAVLRGTHGDLKAASLELTRLPEAWAPLTKLRNPIDYVVAVLRALDLPQDQLPPDIPKLMAGLGQPLMSAPLPNGWPDQAVDWAGSEAMLRRVDWVYGLSARVSAPEPMVVADASLGPLLSQATADAIRGAGSRRDAMTLLLASPEFQRR
jgi:uncharacterized protein (DUF1800 family)